MFRDAGLAARAPISPPLGDRLFRPRRRDLRLRFLASSLLVAPTPVEAFTASSVVVLAAATAAAVLVILGVLRLCGVASAMVPPDPRRLDLDEAAKGVRP